jgi:hypothetical protein
MRRGYCYAGDWEAGEFYDAVVFGGWQEGGEEKN